ncbi:MAG: hypothetical protein QM537_05595, partial [Candidatus Symbiobacter sp.]|nr:hypothetical protein [Candidatus Symbiobacter sp.]
LQAGIRLQSESGNPPGVLFPKRLGDYPTRNIRCTDISAGNDAPFFFRSFFAAFFRSPFFRSSLFDALFFTPFL